MDEQLNTENTEIESRTETDAPAKVPVVITAVHLEKAATTLAALIGFLGLNAEVKAEAQEKKILLTVSSTDAGRIIGRKGQTLESIQFILSRMLLKGEEIFPRIIIDIDGYARQGNLKEGHQRRQGGEGEGAERTARPRNGKGRNDKRSNGDRPMRGNDRGPRDDRGGRDRGQRSERISFEREETLKQQALDYAKEVTKWGEPITLPPMSAMERRIIHIALEDNKEVNTESIGDGARKSVVISQK